jgi:hypothetical protein
VLPSLAWFSYGLKPWLMALNGWLTAKPQLVLHLANLVQLISSMLEGVQDYISYYIEYILTICDLNLISAKKYSVILYFIAGMI